MSRTTRIASWQVSGRLGLVPSESQLANRAGKPLHGWFLSSETHVESRDARRHLDWLLDQLEPASTPLHQLIRDGANADVSCYWLSVGGHGGPALSPSQMLRLGRLELCCWFDVYFAG
ncbi:MAG: DUF4279 domain-containing protein [Planctomycetes bacterium]|nr:DUF4279 domain-containing protein [Planctomycetota bacterium]